MDWLLDPRDPGAVESASAVVNDHLRRHATSADAAVTAEEAVHSVVQAAVSTAGERALWLNLDWTRAEPRLSFNTLTDESAQALLSSGVQPGSAIGARHRALLTPATPRTHESMTVPVTRTIPTPLEVDPATLAGIDVDPRRHGPLAVAIALAAAAETHPTASPDHNATLAGAAIADAVVGDGRFTDTGHLVEAFLEAHRAIGGDPHVVTLDDDRLEISLVDCPFGSTSGHVRSLCRVSAGIVGRLAARLNGESHVVLDESIGFGDPACRLQVFLRAGRDEVGEAFSWPAAASARGAAEAAPRLELTVALPRESSSVPVVRRLAGQALRAFGVTSEDIDDVQLAITEACANVIDHAVDTDTYEVTVELASELCAISVLDRGTGFDVGSVPSHAEDHAEEGRGLTLMRALVDNLAFEVQPQAGAVVRMVKSLSYDTTHPLRRVGA